MVRIWAVLLAGPVAFLVGIIAIPVADRIGDIGPPLGLDGSDDRRRNHGAGPLPVISAPAMIGQRRVHRDDRARQQRDT